MKRIVAFAISTLIFTAFIAAQEQQSMCDHEHVSPNLNLQKRTRVIGALKDQTAAPFKRSRIELRKYVSPGQQEFMKTVLTDPKGYFDLGELQPGRYRLLAAPHRGFKQPKQLECWDRSKCELDITLVVNPTDLPYAGCPIR